MDAMATFRGFNPNKTNVAIIGAGAAGLCAARVFTQAGYRVKMFESTSTIGGTWVYSPTPSPTSALYESLRCNIPKQGMAFCDHPFSATTRSFPSHQEVLHYLRTYESRFQLSKLCSFNQRVKTVIKTEEHGDAMWNLKTYEGFQDTFHIILVCNGHYSKPHSVELTGSREFLASGRNIFHSQSYKTPKPFIERRVLVIGSGPSGVDISVDLSKVASIVFVSHRKTKGSLFQGQNECDPLEVAPVNYVTGKGDVHLIDGTILRDIQDILLSTGYEYSFPFLENGASGISVSKDGDAVYGLIKHCVAAKDPSIAFIGLPWSVIPFPLFEDQAHFLVALYDKDVCRSKLARLFQEELVERECLKSKGRYYHRLGDEQWEYRRQLADFARRAVYAASLIEIVRDASAARHRDPTSYRDREYHVLGPGRDEWRVTEFGVDVTGRDDPDSLSLETGSYETGREKADLR